MEFNVTLKASNGEKYYYIAPVTIKPTSRAVKMWITRNVEKVRRTAFLNLSPVAQQSGVTLELTRVDNGIFIASTRI